jgi:hypothetical protein
MFSKHSVYRILPVIILLFSFVTGLMGEEPQENGRARVPWWILTDTEKGLCGISFAGALSSLWTGGAVRKLIKSDGCWIIQSDQGVLVSEDLVCWKSRNGGFPL